MSSINILFTNNSQKKTFKISIDDKYIIIKINIIGLSNFELIKNINKIKNILKLYNDININILFAQSIESNKINMIISKLHNILHKTFSPTSDNKRQIKLYNVSNEGLTLMNELTLYKQISMDTNKTPDTYLNYIMSKNIKLNDYDYDLFDLSKYGEMFPLTSAVGKGSSYGSYFLHIKPNNANAKAKKKNIFLIGKAVTFDSGGLNIKTGPSMADMYVDMIGSAIVLSVLRLLNQNNLDKKHNINLLLPIVENMVNNNAIRPGTVIKTTTNISVEIENTDAEGRLCIADAVIYANRLIKDSNLDVNDCLILDIATLTGAAIRITNDVSSLIMGNDNARRYINKLLEISNKTSEYLDYLQLREEYIEILSSCVSHIKNSDAKGKAGCIQGGTFINYFNDKSIPLIHIDVAPTTHCNDMVTSYGINLLYEFIKNI